MKLREIPKSEIFSRLAILAVLSGLPACGASQTKAVKPGVAQMASCDENNPKNVEILGGDEDRVVYRVCGRIIIAQNAIANIVTQMQQTADSANETIKTSSELAQDVLNAVMEDTKTEDKKDVTEEKKTEDKKKKPRD